MNKIIGKHYEIQPEEIGSQNIELYNRIQIFSLDRPYSQLSFSNRFGRDLNFVRINNQQNLILSKPNCEVFSRLKLQQVITFPLLIFLSLVVTSCQVISQFPNPINKHYEIQPQLSKKQTHNTI